MRPNSASGHGGSPERLPAPARQPAGFLDGFIAALPLWLGVTPFGFVYAAVARRAGLSVAEIQLMSLLVYAGGAQFTVVRLAAQGTPRHLLVVAAALINLRHVLYGLSLAQYLRPVRSAGRVVAAFFLVDESYGLAMREFLAGRASTRYLLGAGMSLYLAWNVGTVLGTTLTAALPDPRTLGLDLVFPLTFAALLAPLLREAANRWAALTAFLAGVVIVPALPAGIGFVVATLLGLLGGLWVRD